MSTTENLDKVWKSALKLIKSEVPISSFQAWIKPAHLTSLEGNKALLEVKNEFSKNLLIQNYQRSIVKALEASLNHSVDLIINVNRQMQSEEYTPSLSSLDEAAQHSVALAHSSVAANPRSHDTLGQNYLNQKYTFDNFIVGAHNQFCHAAALAIAEQTSNGAYNPFFIYGDVGLGKTHIMQAIGHYLIQKKPQAKILYLSTERFLNDLISHMRKSKMSEFRSKYRSVDLLMIDDIQFIEGKETTQEEFFHTFNALKDNGSQIILTSDRQPKAISRLEPRLCSRFEGGLVADVQAPTYETRLAIISRKADELKMKVKSEVADLIAEAFPGNIRSLEGALVKLQAYTNFTSRPITIDLTRDVLQITTSPENSNSSAFAVSPNFSAGRKTLERIVKEVASKMKVPEASIMSRDNSQETKNARQVAMLIARSKGLTLTEIGQAFDGRGNSSILNSCKKVQKDLENDHQLKKLVEEIEKVIS